jgi:hypothetical protein
MKKLIFIATALMLSVPLSAQFRAKMYFTSMGKDHVFTVYSADAGYRYEFNEDGQEGVILVKTGSPDIYILMPQQKMAMKSSTTDKMSMGNDPVAAFKYYQNEGLMKVEGQETVNGIACTRSGLWNKDNPDQKMFTVWTSDDYNLPVKMINHIDGSSDGSVMELKDVEPWTPDPGYLEVPEGYQVMGMSNMMP